MFIIKYTLNDKHNIQLTYTRMLIIDNTMLLYHNAQWTDIIKGDITHNPLLVVIECFVIKVSSINGIITDIPITTKGKQVNFLNIMKEKIKFLSINNNIKEFDSNLKFCKLRDNCSC